MRLYFTFTFYSCIVPMGHFVMGNSGCLPLGKPAATESLYPAYDACWVFKCFHNPPSSDMDYGIFNVRTYVNVCNCTPGCSDIVRESVLRVDSGTVGEKSLDALGN